MYQPIKIALVLVAAAATASARTYHNSRSLIQEVGKNADTSITTLCNASLVGSKPACFDQSIKTIGNDDYLPGAPQITYPTDGTPWGAHIGGPYPDGVTYLLSWLSGKPTIGTTESIQQPMTDSLVSQVRVSSSAKGKWTTYSGKVITYKRAYVKPTLTNYSYVSPFISHVVLTNLKPGTTYTYQLYNTVAKTWSKSYTFTTVKHSYPLRLGLIADVGQTVNSSDTRDHLIANKPDAIILAGDFSYADNYGADNWTATGSKAGGTNQQRWDSFAVLWESALSKAPLVACAGNHELETDGINATVAWNITSFSYPTNYPFQSYSARYPVPGTTSDFGNINKNQYYSTVIGGKVKVISLNNYIAFGPTSPQYAWAIAEFAKIDRKVTPWVLVQFHTPHYHTYYTHYKEAECFMSIYEDIFYKYGVDLVFTGHVHAYERTHPVYKYQKDDCGPIYVSIGDGGNIEGPYRNFVDQTNPNTNKTYCEALNYGGLGPNQIAAANGQWGPGYQLQAVQPGCQTLSWQSKYSVNGGPALVPKDGSPNLGFCQSSQPLWSAHRDPSFGHAILTITSDTSAQLSWYRNQDSKAMIADSTTLKRKTCTKKARRMAMAAWGVPL